MTSTSLRPRDAEKQMVYNAEFKFRFIMDNSAQTSGVITLAGSTVVLPIERRFGDINAVRDYANRVCARMNLPAVKVRVRRGQNLAHYEAGTANHPAHVIAVPVLTTWALRESVLLHEIAHHQTRMVTTSADHGPPFRAAYLRILETVMGPEASFIMRILYSNEGLTQ